MAVPTRKFMEDTLNSIRDYLRDEFKTTLATIRSERRLTKDELKDVALIERTVIRAPKAYPRIEVLPDGTDHDYGFEDVPLDEPWLFHDVIVWFTHRSGDQDEVRDTLMRYDEALNRITEEDDTYGNAFTDVVIGRADYSVMIEDERDKNVLQMLSVAIRCKSPGVS